VASCQNSLEQIDILSSHRQHRFIVSAPVSGRVLEVLTTEPGVQFYTGNFLDGTVAGRNGRIYRMGDGVALEPQKFPNAPNQASFASARVDPGKPYRHLMVYRLSTSH